MEIMNWRWMEIDGEIIPMQGQINVLPSLPAIGEVVATSRDEDIPSLTMEQLREAINQLRATNGNTLQILQR